MKLECKHLTKSFGEKVALRDFSLEMQEGIYGILGENGAGKSTFMNLLTDNSKRQEGEILWNGKEILTMGGAYRAQLGYMPQQQGYYPDFSAISYLIYMGQLKGLQRKEAKKQGMELLERLHLREVANEKVGGFSGGMRQRVMLAQALLGDPKILILDEPTAGLDPKERITLRNFISELSTNRIILLATHVVSDIECIADSVLLMKQGELLRVDTPMELIQSMEGHVAEHACGKEEISALCEKYPFGTIAQRQDGLVMRIVGDQFEEGFHVVKDNLSLEDVYLYYCT